MKLLFKIFLGGCLCISLLWASAKPPEWFTQEKNREITLQVSLFLSSTCPHCHKADEFFQRLETTTPWLNIKRYTINKDKAALETFSQFLQQQKSTDFSVPAIFFCDSHWIGFADAESTGKELLRGLTYCHEQIIKTGQLNSKTTAVLQQWANANWYGNVLIAKPSVASVILMTAIYDALNPCSLFVILSLIAFLWIAPTRQLRLAVGFLFILTIGVTHYLQQAFNAFFFQWNYVLRIPVLFIGLALLAYTLGYFKTLDGKKSYILIGLAILSALGIQAYMQTCTPNFAVVFEQWLQTKQFYTTQTIVFLIIYQCIYIMPLLLLMLLAIWLSKAARFTSYQIIFKKFAHIFLIMTALLFMIYPAAFAQLAFSFLLFVVTIFMAILLRKKALPLL
ncbi:glutaredoxin family protein [Legionella jamestowniensis]|uniref:Thioredoxin domain-containing protein n=1 Tax=Legionella jamestowniensis TaxID=455 RepID=A0A0W0UG06_9GAMM|nr:hypothetical protein [Legionella jamestowniensis]KTD06834.1 hypothetical protein Ljam_1029 [Legionella jamestowniensis]OCH97579.1 hypothetical protein A8135_13885 [Legionella jamestowniensis]SFL82516.1 Glutaredoxin [Legionella jamestowniensis DSM 19215]